MGQPRGLGRQPLGCTSQVLDHQLPGNICQPLCQGAWATNLVRTGISLKKLFEVHTWNFLKICNGDSIPQASNLRLQRGTATWPWNSLGHCGTGRWWPLLSSNPDTKFFLNCHLAISLITNNTRIILHKKLNSILERRRATLWTFSFPQCCSVFVRDHPNVICTKPYATQNCILFDKEYK